ncbi:MAG TPA: iron ABC transporter permease [Candidatus Nanopelagicales bacterium]|nr:iron ABC transporter permease [Candidatus Nanopelagicales bacterium]
MNRGLALAGLGLAAVAAVLLSLRYGAVGLDLGQVLAAVRGAGDPSAVTIVRDLRLPRAVLAALVGGALALSGAAFQALLRNPLAEPYVLGVSSGAAVGAVAWIAAGGLVVARLGLPLAALAGALVAIALVLRIGSRVGGLDVRVLLLAGVVAGSFFNACILLLLSFQQADAFRSAVFWMMGSLAGATWGGVAFMAAVVAAGGAALISLARPFNALAVGEETAAFLGVPVDGVRRAAYLIASGLAASAVVVAGGIGFVGLVVPHAVRIVWGGEHRFLLPASFLVGAAFLPLADLVARLVVAPNELPLGVVTAFIGVPFFVGLLRRQARGVEA